MKLVLVRHATAVPAEEGVADESRTLTDRGRERFTRAVRGLRRLGMRFDVLIHSPWTRAVETADLLLPLVDGESRVCMLLARAPGRPLLVELAALGDKTVALVGHEPWLGELTMLLITGKASAVSLELKKGAVALLEGEAKPAGMRLQALLPPRVLRAL
jgi:phosphohistidine phosphatase